MKTMTERLFRVGMKHKTTGEQIKIMVWAEDVDKATEKIVNAFGGYRSEYTWTGSGPEIRDNEVIKREVK